MAEPERGSGCTMTAHRRKHVALLRDGNLYFSHASPSSLEKALAFAQCRFSVSVHLQSKSRA